jgi:hypothetical protein
MIGIFLVNPEGNVCFAQLGQHRQIASLRLVPGPCCMVVLSDGSEEMFTDEIHADILGSLRTKAEILVVHAAEDGSSVEEYTVSLDVAL